MRYELTKEERLAIYQDQIDQDLRDLAALTVELGRIPEEDVDGHPGTTRREGIERQLEVLRASHERTVAEAKALEKRG